ncbi:hypothetical protein E4U43_002215 [Claviceps pusilla]|uniref:Chromo domain-containing protein n=1 Tax=Claviceps pusilla TaxID=123648 RepID=A0A9P7N921_9HYPO|nr:hypothetical protein E4U43_002215 [Claviceps pusilla]
METIGIGHSTRRSGAELPFPKKPTTAQDGTSSPRSNIVVAIRPRPNYVPGTGPALQPPRLLPLAASTGYIIERILLPSPGLAADGRPLPKRMTYIVGWRDLPAASLRVPAMDILQYVSLGALEDWEDRLEDEMDDHRQHVGDETGRLGGKDMASPKTRRRPPAHSAIEQPAAIESESEPEPEPEPEPGVGPHAKSQGMSLSTPRKRKLAEFEGLSDDDDDNSPTKQLARELLGNSDGAEHVMPSLVDRHNGKTIITAMDRGLKREESIDTTGYKLPSTVTPVPLPPFIAYQSNHGSSGPGASIPSRAVVSLGMDRSSESPHEKEDPVVLSIEGGDTLSNGRRSVALANVDSAAVPVLPARGPSRDQAKRRTSTSQTPTSLVQGRRRSEPTRKRTKKQHRGTLAPSEMQTTSTSTNTTTTTTTTTTQQADDTAWEVERLEDMALYDVENQGLVRYFLVRWVGDWPPEQNPSWEPEDNIPADLVRTYTKMDKKRRAKLAASHQRPPPDPSGWALERRYQSVSEAFGGNVEQDVASTAVVNGDPGNHSLDNEMFVVTDGVQDHRQQGVKETPVPLPPTAFAYWTSR